MSADDIYAALDRTALLLQRDVFGPGAGRRAIIDGFRGTTARIIADRANLASPAGQTAAVTLYALLAMQGLQIDLDLPAVQLLVPQPPLAAGDLQAGLLGYAASLLPGGSSRPAPAPGVTFAIGDSPAPRGAVRVSGTAWTAAVGGTGDSPRWHGAGAAGPMAAAAAAAADGLRAAVPQIAGLLGRPAPAAAWRLVPGRVTRLDLSTYQAGDPTGLGEVDVISGGAITSACLYALLRLPRAAARLRIIEPDRLEISNLNRYPLALRPMCGWQKTRALAAFQTARIRITGTDTSLNEDTLPGLAPFAPRMLVGTDHIPSRWTAQRAAPGWVGVGASSHDFVLVSAHPPGSACAGCVHPRDEGFAGDIPTISFVSFWAGLMLALELAAAAGGQAPGWTRATNLWPLGLDNPRGIQHLCQAAAAACPVGCGASTAQLSGPGTR